MTKEEKEKYINKPALGVAVTMPHVTVRAVEGDTAIFTVPALYGKVKVHTAKIKHSNGKPYFFFENAQIFLDDLQ